MIVSFVAISICVIAYLVMYILFSPVSFGAFEINNKKNLVDLSILIVATFLGVLSKPTFEKIFNDEILNLKIYSKYIFMACAISPLAMFPIYQAIGDINNSFLVFLMAYQNGFFFTNVFFIKK